MKFAKILSIAAIAAAALIPANMLAQQPRNIAGSIPGIALAASQNYQQLPEGARKFINRHFKNVGIASTERYFAKGTYEVELANGIDIEFDNKGTVREINAPDAMVLASEVVKDVLPGKSFRRLNDAGLSSSVESIEFNRRGKAIEVELAISDPDTYIFDLDGNFLAIQD